jgi:hypothetical protein
MASKTLFDHIKAITTEQRIDYWETLEEGDKKTWSNYMIHRFLSMNPDWIEVLSEIQPYTQVLEPKNLYLACSIKEAEEYCEILYSTREGRENIKYICEQYGVEKKQITKLKLKV